MVPDGDVCYDRSFVLSFLLLKLNSWLAHAAFPHSPFLPRLLSYYNSLLNGSPSQFKYSRNDGELMAQLLLASGADEWMKVEEVEEALEGSGLVAATAVEAVRLGGELARKCYFVVVLGLVSLHGRTNPYLAIVHKDKNHLGQIEFAKRIDELIHLNPNVPPLPLRSRRSTLKSSKTPIP
jgi:hypothetical protein